MMQDLMNQARAALLNGDEKLFGKLCAQADDALLPDRRYEELLEFYDAALRQVASKEQYQGIRALKYSAYASEFAKCLEQAIARAREEPEVQAIYYEYTDDESNFFLCNSFDEDAECWASDFEADGVVSGPDVSFCKGQLAEQEDDWEPLAETVRDLCIDACLLVQAFRQIDALRDMEYPFGFAEHDGVIATRLPDKK